MPFQPDHEPKFGANGQIVFERTYSRQKPDGTYETWAETVDRVVEGNAALVDPQYIEEGELDKLKTAMYDFKVIPGGRHLWSSGVTEFLANCFIAPVGPTLSRHSGYLAQRLFEGGGVGSRYANEDTVKFGRVSSTVSAVVSCDANHKDFTTMLDQGMTLLEPFSSDIKVEDSREGWVKALTTLIDMFFDNDVSSSLFESPHQLITFDVSDVRPAGAPLKTFGGSASGPAPLVTLLDEVAAILNRRVGQYVTPIDVMEIDHEIARAVVAGGNRRSARMASMPWDDPYIFDFLACKKDFTKHWTTNISVAIDDAFIDHIKQGDPNVNPEWSNMDAKTVIAHQVYDAVVKGMLTNGEPGILNVGLARETDDEVITSNPCGEQMMGVDSCNLVNVNLQAFDSYDQEQEILEAHELAIRFGLRATFGSFSDPELAAQVAKNRRVGVGHMGTQGFLAKQGISYRDITKLGTTPQNLFIVFLNECYQTVRNVADDYADEMGVPRPKKVTCVAPTGTTAKMPGVTEGIHPLYAKYLIKRIRFSTIDPKQQEQTFVLLDKGHKIVPDIYAENTVVVEFVTKDSLVEEVEALGFNPDEVIQSSDELTLEELLVIQAIYQNWYADNAVSFTANVVEGRYSVEDVQNVLSQLLPMLKGTTMMPDATRPLSPYERLTKEQFESLSSPKTVESSINEDCANGSCPIK